MKNQSKLTLSLTLAFVAIFSFGCQSSSYQTSTVDTSKILEEIVVELNSKPVVEPLGFTANNIYALEEEMQPIASKELGMNGRLQVIEIRKGSLAEKAGFQKGDHLVDIGGNHIPRDSEAYETMINDILPELDFSKPITVIVLRNGLGTILSIPASIEKAS